MHHQPRRALEHHEGFFGQAAARHLLKARQCMAPRHGHCLGVGVPFAIAAALAFPERQAISVNGDGAFGINAVEIDTAVRHGAKAVFIVSNNGAWNIERFDQETNYGGRVVGTTLGNSDYAAMAHALANAPAVVDVVTSQTVVSSDARKGLGFVPDYQALTAWHDAERKGRGLA